MSTIEELNAEIQARSNEIDEAKNELRKLCRKRDVQAELEKISPAVRAQIIADAGKITSEEKHGRLGGS